MDGGEQRQLQGDSFVRALLFTGVNNGLTLFPLVPGIDGSSFQKERNVHAGSIWDSCLGYRPVLF